MSEAFDSVTASLAEAEADALYPKFVVRRSGAASFHIGVRLDSSDPPYGLQTSSHASEETARNAAWFMTCSCVRQAPAERSETDAFEAWWEGLTVMQRRGRSKNQSAEAFLAGRRSDTEAEPPAHPDRSVFTFDIEAFLRVSVSARTAGEARRLAKMAVEGANVILAGDGGGCRGLAFESAELDEVDGDPSHPMIDALLTEMEPVDEEAIRARVAEHLP